MRRYAKEVIGLEGYLIVLHFPHESYMLKVGSMGYAFCYVHLLVGLGSVFN